MCIYTSLQIQAHDDDAFVDELYDVCEESCGIEFMDNEGVGLYSKQAMLNHDCEPNAEIKFLHDNHKLSVVATRDIEKGEEVCIRLVRFRKFKMPSWNKKISDSEFGSFLKSLFCIKICQNSLNTEVVQKSMDPAVFGSTHETFFHLKFYLKIIFIDLILFLYLSVSSVASILISSNAVFRECRFPAAWEISTLRK